MGDLIGDLNLGDDSSGDPVLKLIRSGTCCIASYDTQFFKDSPETYVCNLYELSKTVKRNGINVQYGRNRSPMDDPNKIQQIIDYQMRQIPDGMEEDPIYDTADWKLTFATIGSNMTDCRLIDGGHRFIAAQSLPRICSVIQIRRCETEVDRFNLFKIINKSSDLPEIYRLDESDIYSKLCKLTIDKLVLLHPLWFWTNRPSDYNNGVVLYAPFLDMEKLKNLLFEHRHAIYGKCDEISDLDQCVQKTIDNLLKFNSYIKLKYRDVSDFQALFAELVRLKKRCTAHNASANSRCVRAPKIGNVCGYHPNKSCYIDPSFDTILGIADKNSCYLGLYLTQQEFIVKYTESVNTIMDMPIHQIIRPIRSLRMRQPPLPNI